MENSYQMPWASFGVLAPQGFSLPCFQRYLGWPVWHSTAGWADSCRTRVRSYSATLKAGSEGSLICMVRWSQSWDSLETSAPGWSQSTFSLNKRSLTVTCRTVLIICKNLTCGPEVGMPNSHRNRRKYWWLKGSVSHLRSTRWCPEYVPTSLKIINVVIILTREADLRMEVGDVKEI